MAKAPSMDAQMKDMQAHADLGALIHAAKVKNDPARHKAAMKKHKEKMAELKSVVTQQPSAPPAGEPDDDDMGSNGGAY